MEIPEFSTNYRKPFYIGVILALIIGLGIILYPKIMLDFVPGKTIGFTAYKPTFVPHGLGINGSVVNVARQSGLLGGYHKSVLLELPGSSFILEQDGSSELKCPSNSTTQNCELHTSPGGHTYQLDNALAPDGAVFDQTVQWNVGETHLTLSISGRQPLVSTADWGKTVDSAKAISVKKFEIKRFTDTHNGA